MPSTYVMEGMRAVVLNGSFSWSQFALALGLNAVYMIVCALHYSSMLERGRINGQLIRLSS